MATKASIENERIGRELFQVFIDQFPNELEWTPTNNIHDYIDGIVRYHENNYSAVEIKTRNKKYENYDTYLMELDKYINVRNRMRSEKCHTIWYVNFFDKDSLYIFDFRKFNPNELKITEMWVLQSTCEPWLGYRRKKFINLPKEYANHYKFENSSWKKVS